MGFSLSHMKSFVVVVWKITISLEYQLYCYFFFFFDWFIVSAVGRKVLSFTFCVFVVFFFVFVIIFGISIIIFGIVDDRFEVCECRLNEGI